MFLRILPMRSRLQYSTRGQIRKKGECAWSGNRIPPLFMPGPTQAGKNGRSEKVAAARDLFSAIHPVVTIQREARQRRYRPPVVCVWCRLMLIVFFTVGSMLVIVVIEPDCRTSTHWDWLLVPAGVVTVCPWAPV